MTQTVLFVKPPYIVQFVLFLIVVPAAIFDLRERRVPNWITLSGIVVAAALNSFLGDWTSTGFDDFGLWMALKGLGIAMLIYFPLYLLRGMGAGDVKLMAAVGAAVGWKNWLGILLLTAIFGALSAVVVIATRGRFRKTMQNVWFIIVSLFHRQAPHEGNPELDVKSSQAIRLPHAVAIAFGTLGFLTAAAIWAPK